VTNESTEKVLNRVLFCTSPLQVINARSAMDRIGSKKKCKDYVVITHPLINESSKKIIKEIAKILGYYAVIDLSYLLKVNESNTSGLSLIKKLKNINTILSNIINRHHEIQKNIYNILDKEIKKIDIIFYRSDYKYVDSLFINALSCVERYGIEDGIGDYMPQYYYFITFNIYEIKHKIKSLFISYTYLFISFLLNGKYKINKNVFLNPNCKYIDDFTNIKKKGSIYVGNSFKKYITKLSNHSTNKFHEKQKIIILGTIYHPRYKMDLYRETEIYNRVIEQIIVKFNIKKEEIWYKQHPRLSYSDWEYKKENLNCSIYDYNDYSISEIKFINEYLIAVYSFGSSGLLYAKKIFNINSYLIDISREKGMHPSTFKTYLYIASKYDINTIIIN